jgi:hypothetical protein
MIATTAQRAPGSSQQQAAPAPRAWRACRTAAGDWRISIASATEPGTWHTLTVAHGRAGRCDCGAAGMGVVCYHRRDAHDLAGALALRHAAQVALARLQAAPEAPGNRLEIDRLQGEVWFAERCIRKMGYAVPTGVAS